MHAVIEDVKHAEALSVGIDPDSPYFGKCRVQPAPKGTALVILPDLKDFHPGQVIALVRFC